MRTYKAYEADIVVLEDPRTITWAGGTTDALVARHRSYLEGELIDLNVSIDTPSGPRTDGLLVRAFQDDGTMEEKTYLPGLGVSLEVGATSELRLASPG